ncbi:cytochrome P450 [Haloactinospora alba]|uniref:Cytochrome P450 n=1 Tax=Haloactinospora alba TaxID=405555 RepID=A0A543NJG5_9ACTN|nr:cytochrome P450 [Haloactinospora alba]TQN31959.1 cytochrome P450 [Haloactinospora alba]
MHPPHSPASGTGPPPNSACPLYSGESPPPVPLTGQENLAELRERYGSAAPVELEPGVRAWLLLGYQENLEALRNTRSFSNDPRKWSLRREGHIPPDSPLRYVAQHLPQAATNDGEVHRRLRSPVAAALRRLDEETLQARVQYLADLHIDAFSGRGHAELVEEYGSALPAAVLNWIIGVSDDERAPDIAATDPQSSDRATAHEQLRTVTQYFTELARRKRDSPGHDLVSQLVAHESNLSDTEVAHSLTMLVTSGHGTTSALIGNALYRVLTDADLRSALFDFQLRVDDLVEQTLWNDPPQRSWLGRYAREDLRFGSADIRAGDGIVIGFAAAHSDPTATGSGESAAGLGSATNRAHLSWGAGAHQCPGQHLAWHIATTGISALLRRLPDTRLGTSPARIRRSGLLNGRGLLELPVTFTPVAASRSGGKTPPSTPETAQYAPRGGVSAPFAAMVARWRRRR